LRDIEKPSHVAEGEPHLKNYVTKLSETRNTNTTNINCPLMDDGRESEAIATIGLPDKSLLWYELMQ
jgi:hypothetical protein